MFGYAVQPANRSSDSLELTAARVRDLCSLDISFLLTLNLIPHKRNERPDCHGHDRTGTGMPASHFAAALALHSRGKARW